VINDLLTRTVPPQRRRRTSLEHVQEGSSVQHGRGVDFPTVLYTMSKQSWRTRARLSRCLIAIKTQTLPHWLDKRGTPPSCSNLGASLARQDAPIVLRFRDHEMMIRPIVSSSPSPLAARRLFRLVLARSDALSTCCHQLSRAAPHEFTHNRVTRSLCDSIVKRARARASCSSHTRMRTYASMCAVRDFSRRPRLP